MWLWLLAQEAVPGPAPVTPNQPSPLAAFFPIALMLGVLAFLIMSARSQKRREQTTRDQMYAKLAKNQRVLTVGGIVGTVMSVKDDEVVLKVDESTNTKMTFLKTAVQRIMDDPEAPAARS